MHSEQRVLDHCRIVLAANDLGAEERRRLERLAAEAQARLAAMVDTPRGDRWAA
jgi:hypothetical protein